MKITYLKRLTDFKWLNLFSVHWENKDKEGDWIFASRKQAPILGGDTKPDAVVIVPIHVNEKGERHLVVVKECRPPIGDYQYAFPAGLCTEEDVLKDAVRELKEETGFTLTGLTDISPLMFSSAGMTDESAVMIFCECEGKISQENLEITEDIEVQLLDYIGVCNLCDGRRKISAKTWPVLLMYKKLGKI